MDYNEKGLFYEYFLERIKDETRQIYKRHFGDRDSSKSERERLRNHLKTAIQEAYGGIC